MKMLIELFYTFSKIGAFNFGGGYAILPFIEKEIVINNGW
ncbi:MAG TPA: chromate transporter, partial [Bacillota bacterium]|nr:chromate transporter [Bacillota bacterium]